MSIVTRRVAGLLSALACVPVLALTAGAQDTHYWTTQYGTRSTLLGGAVIGSVTDLTAAYYNPGAIPLFDDRSFIVSARVYEYTTLTLEDGSEPGVDLTDTRFKPAPDFIGGEIRAGWLGEHKLVYSLLTKQRMDIGIQARRVDQRDVLDRTPGDEEFAAGTLFSQDVSETWGGLSWAYSKNGVVGIGATTFIAYRSQSTRFQQIAEALASTGEFASTIHVEEFKFSSARLLWKAGVGLALDPVTLGLSVTTPGIHLAGSGTSLVNHGRGGQDVDGDGTLDPELLADGQIELSAEYRSPWSVGVGGAVTFGGTTIHASAEWFDSVPVYRVIDSEPFVGQSSGELEPHETNEALASVLNYGLGLQVRFSSGFTGFTSLTADHSAAVEDVFNPASVSNWDLYHFGLGVAFQAWSSEFTLGASFSQGKQDINSAVTFDQAHESNEMLGLPGGEAVLIRTVKLVFGFTLNI